MTTDEFVTHLFGEGWTPEQLPIFAHMLKQAQDDARRYHELRDHLAMRNGKYIPTRKDMEAIDDFTDAARYCGII